MKGKMYILGAMLLVGLMLSTGCAKKSVGPGDGTAGSATGTGDMGQEAETQRQAREALEAEALRERQLAEQRRAEAETARDRAAGVEQVVQEIQDARIYFNFDSFELSAEARTILQKKAELLGAHPELNVLIEGHCDERGTEEYNIALGERRAKAAYEFLILLGVDSTRIQIISFGEEYPADPANTETAWAKNRRAEFKIRK